MSAPGTVRTVAGVDVVELSGTAWRLPDGTVCRVLRDLWGTPQWTIHADTGMPRIIAGSLVEAVTRWGNEVAA